MMLFSAIVPWCTLRGADRDRTDGLLVANEALSQLSYSPMTLKSTLQDTKLTSSSQAPITHACHLAFEIFTGAIRLSESLHPSPPLPLMIE
jgi:hypothetical protein